MCIGLSKYPISYKRLEHPRISLSAEGLEPIPMGAEVDCMYTLENNKYHKINMAIINHNLKSMISFLLFPQRKRKVVFNV